MLGDLLGFLGLFDHFVGLPHLLGLRSFLVHGVDFVSSSLDLLRASFALVANLVVFEDHGLECLLGGSLSSCRFNRDFSSLGLGHLFLLCHLLLLRLSVDLLLLDGKSNSVGLLDFLLESNIVGPESALLLDLSDLLFCLLKAVVHVDEVLLRDFVIDFNRVVSFPGFVLDHNGVFPLGGLQLKDLLCLTFAFHCVLDLSLSHFLVRDVFGFGGFGGSDFGALGGRSSSGLSFQFYSVGLLHGFLRGNTGGGGDSFGSLSFLDVNRSLLFNFSSFCLCHFLGSTGARIFFFFISLGLDRLRGFRRIS